MIYHSILKYFSFLNLNTFCIITHSALPQSKAGIGNMLNIANANDIIPAKARYNTRPPDSSNFHQNLTTHTGQVSQFKDHLICDQLNETKLFHKFHSAEKVNLVCAHISLSHIQIDCGSEYFISFKINVHDVENAIPNIQLSSGHDVEKTFCNQFLL